MKTVTKSIVAALVAVSLLGGCAHTGSLMPTKTVYKVVKPEESLFTCERVQLPNPSTLTDAQVAQLVNELVKANRQCANNMNAIKQYLNAAQQILEERKKS